MAGMLQSRYNPRTKRIEYGPAETTLPEIAVTAGEPEITPPGPSAAMAQVAPPMPGPVAPNPGGGMMRKPLGAFFEDLERSRGLPAGYLAKTRAIESSNGKNLVNPNSSARGDFQFIRSTAKAVGLRNPMDPYESAEKAADLAKGNAAAFRARTGQDPTGADLYGMHQQGSAGYLKLMNGQRTGEAEMRLNGGAGLTGSQMVAKIHGMFDKAKPANLGEGFTFQAPAATSGPGPTMEAAAKMGPAEAVQPVVQPPAVQPEKYNGGILGLMQGSDYSGAGASKDFAGKMGDLTGGPNFAGAISGLAKAFGGGDQPQQQDRPIVVNPDNVNVPNMQFLELLKRRRTGVV